MSALESSIQTLPPYLTLSEGLRSTVPSPDMTLFAPSNLKAARREWDPFSLWDSWGFFEILKKIWKEKCMECILSFIKLSFGTVRLCNTLHTWNVSCLSWRKHYLLESVMHTSHVVFQTILPFFTCYFSNKILLFLLLLVVKSSSPLASAPSALIGIFLLTQPSRSLNTAHIYFAFYHDYYW